MRERELVHALPDVRPDGAEDLVGAEAHIVEVKVGVGFGGACRRAGDGNGLTGDGLEQSPPEHSAQVRHDPLPGGPPPGLVPRGAER